MKGLFARHFYHQACNQSFSEIQRIYGLSLLSGNISSYVQNVRKNSSFGAIPSTMNCWGFSGVCKGVEGLQKCQVPTPSVTNPDDVLIKVEAASVNPLDIFMLDGYGDKILSLQRCLSKSHKTKEINHSNGLNVCECQIVATTGPCIEVAGMPYAGLTSYSALVLTACSGSVGSLGGKRVLVAGAAGGVGLMAVQLLTAWGAHVTGVCSARNFELLANLGITELYDYNDKESMSELLQSRSYDIVLDGSPKRDLPYLDALRVNAGATYVALLGPLLLNTDQYGIPLGLGKSLLELGCKNVSTLFQGRTVKWGLFVPSRTGLETINDFFGKGLLKPVTDIVFPFDEAIAAYQHMENGSHTGKTIISMQ